MTVDFRSSRNPRGTALAIDHAPLRIALQYRFRANGPAGEAETSGQGDTGCGDDGPALCKAVHRRGAEVGAGELEQIATFVPGSTPGPKLATHGQFHAQSGFDGIGRRFGKEAMAEQRHDGSDHRVEVVKAAAPWLRPAPLGEAHSWGNQWQYTDASTFLHVLWPGLCCVPLEDSQFKSDTVAIETNKHTLLTLQRT